MSTRCNVAIRVREEDKGKEINDFITMEPGANYLMIYIHHDGYPEGVGAYLLKHLTNYDKVLEYICDGDRSSTETSYVMRGEEFFFNQPEQLESIRGEIPNEYLYVFEKDTWLVTEDGKTFNKLEDVLL